MLRFRKPTEKERDWLMVIPAGAVYFSLQNVMQDERAFIVAMSIYVFYVIISREWERRREMAFWTVITFFVLVHAVLLSLITLPHYKGPGIGIAFPFMFIDGFAMWGILKWCEKRFPPTTD